MNSPDELPGASANEPNRFDHLQRILSAVEDLRRQDTLDVLLAILLSVTALTSTWCAYQSQLWNGEQLEHLADAEIASQFANQRILAATQRKTLDAIVLSQYLEAVESDRMELAEAIHRRMPSPMREAIDAWWKLDPLHNPDAPGPAEMSEYALVEIEDAEKARDEAKTLRAAAHAAGHQGDRYVLLALLFALVLFFGGIACTIRSTTLRHCLAGLACLMFVVTAIWLFRMPVCDI